MLPKISCRQKFFAPSYFFDFALLSFLSFNMGFFPIVFFIFPIFTYSLQNESTTTSTNVSTRSQVYEI